MCGMHLPGPGPVLCGLDNLLLLEQIRMLVNHVGNDAPDEHERPGGLVGREHFPRASDGRGEIRTVPVG